MVVVSPLFPCLRWGHKSLEKMSRFLCFVVVVLVVVCFFIFLVLFFIYLFIFFELNWKCIFQYSKHISPTDGIYMFCLRVGRNVSKDSFHDTLTRKQVFQTVEHLWNQSLKKYGNCRCNWYKHEVYRYQKSTGTDQNGFCEMLLANFQCSLFILFLSWKYPVTVKNVTLCVSWFL